MQCLKVQLAISVTQDGIIISVNDEPNKKAKGPIDFTEDGILIINCFNEMQSSKVHSSFEVTEEGIFIFFKDIYQF